MTPSEIVWTAKITEVIRHLQSGSLTFPDVPETPVRPTPAARRHRYTDPADDVILIETTCVTDNTSLRQLLAIAASRKPTPVPKLRIYRQRGVAV